MRMFIALPHSYQANNDKISTNRTDQLGYVSQILCNTDESKIILWLKEIELIYVKFPRTNYPM